MSATDEAILANGIAQLRSDAAGYRKLATELAQALRSIHGARQLGELLPVLFEAEKLLARPEVQALLAEREGR